jgi:ribosomal protein S18 acetylase RimI-like enzyme
MLAALAAIPPPPALPDGVGPARALRAGDAPALGRLAFDAYRGSVDDDGQDEAWHREDMEGTLAGRYGELLGHSRVIAVAQDGPLAAAVLLTWHERLALLAFCLTDPAWRGRGLASHLIATSARALEADGHREMHLAVTDGNPAQALYQRLGFRVVPVPGRATR